MSVAPASELVPIPAQGRHYVSEQVVRLGDVGPDGLLRLDATARHLQDVANDDAVDAGLENSFGWVVRRTVVAVRAPAVLGEHLQLTTFCSGIGRCWAERRTSIVGSRGGHVEAASLWVQVDPITGRPTALGDDFHRIYAAAAQGRTVSTRLSLPRPPADAERHRWTVRRSDLDVFDHVNNAVHWALLEESLDARPAIGRAEIEYAAAVGGDDTDCERVVAGDDERVLVWLVVGGDVRVAVRFRAASAGDRLHEHGDGERPREDR